MTPLSLVLLLVCVFFIGLLSYILFNLLFVVSSKKTKSLHNNKGKPGGLNVFSGDVHNSFESPRNSAVINGLRLTRDKRTGKINVEPNGTFSDHAIFRTLNK